MIKLLFILFITFSISNAIYDQQKVLTNQEGYYESLLQYQSKLLRDSTIPQDSLSKIVHQAKFIFKAESETQLDVKIIDPKNVDRFSMPKIEPFISLYKDSDKNQPASTTADISFEVKTTAPFEFNLKRNSTQEIIFSCSKTLHVSDLYLQYTSALPTNDIFGLGERNNMNLKLRNGIYTLFAKDQLHTIDDGVTGGKSVYSSHPLYLVREKSGNYHVVFYKNPTPSDAIIEDNQITFKSIGGIINFKIFLGDKYPETAIKLYHQYLGGGHALPPFWAFGFHQSRWGYRTAKEVVFVINKHKQEGIPLDSIWADLDLMYEKQTFTVDENRFSLAFFKQLQNEENVNYIPIVDVGVGTDPWKGQNIALMKGIEMDIFCRSPKTGRRFQGRVWPGSSYFPDFFNPKTEEYWIDMMTQFYNKTGFTGIWLDMNEPSNFCNGECNQNNVKTLKEEIEKADYVNEDYLNSPIELEYTPGRGSLETNTISLNLLHFGNYTHKDVHNLYGFIETFYTHKALKGLNKQYPFILTRSSFPGSGRYSFKWSGDNVSTYEYLQISIPSIINLNIFGIPFSGADICGFLSNTNAQLCQRWIQLGSLYPFARNHNQDIADPQELYSFGQELIHTSISSLKLRYSILKHYFMLYIKTNHKGTVFKPLFFAFPEDENCLLDKILNSQFMIGTELMGIPILNQYVTTTNAYFPQGKWFDVKSGFKVKDDYKGQYKEIYNDLNEPPPLFIREGSLMGYQNSDGVSMIKDLNNQFKLICSLQQSEQLSNWSCSGSLLNVSNFLDQNEVQENCDQEINQGANCILSVKITVLEEKRQIGFALSSYDEKGVWEQIKQDKLKIVESLAIDSILIYNFPFELSSNPKQFISEKGEDEVTLNLKKFNYKYNAMIKFSKLLLLSQIQSFQIVY